MKSRFSFLFVVFAGVALSTSIMTSTNAMAAKAKKSLYERLGGKDSIAKVVDEFVAKVGADKRINDFFAATVADPNRLAGFKAKMVDQICEATGGPCKYTGRDMKTVHQGMGIKSADFDALVEDLVATLNKLKVGKKEQKDLLAILGPMKKDIVEKP